MKEKGVTVWFEKENIRSADENIELVITIHTMLAQEEIRNMSENIQWGFKRRFEQGITLNNYKYFYGYDVINGELVINEQQAAVVRDIYEWYLQGMSLGQIKKRLEEKKIKTASGKDVWSKSVIQEMLCNEKYMGDCMLQKYFTEDYLSGKKAKNIGQRDKYYVHDSHEGIISKEKFLEVACEMNRRKNLAVKNDDEIVKKGRKYNPQNVELHFVDERKEGRWSTGVQPEWKRGERHVRSHRLLEKNGLKRNLERESAEGSMMKRLSGRKWTRV